MKISHKNRFLAHSLASVSITAAALLGMGGAAHATDYSYGSITENFTITASDQARVLGAGVASGGTFNDNNWGAVYDRGTDQDATYMHFNPLFSLVGTTINGDVNLNLTVETASGGGGEIYNGIIGTATSAWSYPGSAPGITTFTPVAAPNQNYANGATATWAISNATFTGMSIMGDLANFKGLGITAGDGSRAHFSAPATLTGNYTGAEVRVYGASDWSAASWNNGTKTLNISGTSNVTGGNVALATGATLSLTGSATLDSGSFAGNIATSGTLAFGSSANQTLSGQISGSGSLVKSGNSTLTLNGSISYKGGTTVNGGTLELPGGDWITGDPWSYGGATGAITVGPGAILSTSNGVTGIKNGLTVNGGTVSSRGLGYDGSWGNLFLLSNITAGGTATSTISSQINLSGNRTITVDTGSTLNLTGKLNAWNTVRSGITKSGSGTLTLSGANGYNGVTDITAGTLVAANSSALGESGWSGDNMTWVRDGATLALQGGVNIPDHMHVFGTGVGGLGAIRSLSGNNALTMTYGNSGSGPGFSIDSNTTIGVDADSLTLTGFYETGGSFGITKVGNGTLVLTQASTYTGPTLISAGKIALNHASALQYSAFNTASVNGGLDVTGYATPTLGGLTGSVNLSPTLITGYGSVTGLALNPQTGITRTYSGIISNGSGAMTLTKSGGGTQVLTGNNSYSGATLIHGGTLEFSAGTSTIGDITNSFASLVFSGSSIVTGGTLHFQGANPNPQLTISGNADVTLTGGITHQPAVGGDPYHSANYNFLGGTLHAPSISGPSTSWNQAGASMHFDGTRIVATVDNADFITTIGWDHTNTINLRSTSGAIFDTAGYNIGLQVVLANDPNNPSGQGGKLTKLGNGTLTLANANTYTGATTVNAGTLALGASGSIASTTASIAAGATLDTTAKSSYTLPANVTFGVDGTSGAVGTINALGQTLAISGTTAAFNVTGALTATAYVLATYGSLSGTPAFAAISGSLPSGYVINYTYNGNTQIALVKGGFGPWMDTYYSSLSNKDASADPDNDGVKNLMEYVLNGNPGASDSSMLPQLVADPSDFVFQFTRLVSSADDTTQVFEYGSDLTGWTPVHITAPTDSAVTFGTPFSTATGDAQTVTVRIPKSYAVDGKLFGRLKVSK